MENGVGRSVGAVSWVQAGWGAESGKRRWWTIVAGFERGAILRLHRGCESGIEAEDRHAIGPCDDDKTRSAPSRRQAARRSRGARCRHTSERSGGSPAAPEVRGAVLRAVARQACLRISHHGTHQFTAEVTTMLLLKPRHQVMIEQAAIRLPTEKQSAFFDRVTGQLQRQQFSSTGGWPTATSPTRSRGCCAG